jgi:hypothetical protein
MKTNLSIQSYGGSVGHSAIFGLMLALVSFNGQLHAQSSGQEFVPFSDFLDSTKEASAADHMTRAASRVKDVAAFEEMRQHILSLYQGVQVNHSFLLNSSQFDCVPVSQQPTARVFGVKNIPAPPPQALITRQTKGAPNPASERAKMSDEFGNSLGCEEQTIPMRRVTLEEVTHFPTLHDFLAKSPDSTGHAKAPRPLTRARGLETAAPPADDPTFNHRYAIMQQTVDNIGGSSTLNVWSPDVNQDYGEVMSLSQEWYVGGSDASTQTAEVGWQVQPGTWGTQDPVLFIYWTAADYDQTDYPGSLGGGCYNLTCAGFYQLSNEGFLGASLTSSISGDAQYEFSAEYYLYNGNWWLAINGTWIGFFPGSIYQGGQMTANAQLILFGTETYATAGVWPPAGSGDFSNWGWSYAAYQRDLYYFNTSAESISDDLTAYQPAPTCYSASDPRTDDSGAVFFYVGGPGGAGC